MRPLLADKDNLEGWKEALSGLPTCREFHEGVIADTPTCPHCHLRPAQRQRIGGGDEMLDHFDERLGDLLTRWRQALQANLSSDGARCLLAAALLPNCCGRPQRE